MDASKTKMQTCTERLTELFRFRGEQEVKAFLDKHDDLAPLLIEATAPIRRLFGEKTPVVLEVFRDPEAEEDESELFALIQTNLPVEEARGLRAQLDEEWWLENSARADCRLNIDVEFRHV